MQQDDPTPGHLLDHPQLAVLAVLDHALHLASDAIVASHSELMTGEGYEEAPPDSASAWIALDVLQMIAALCDVIDNYRFSLRSPHRPTPAPVDEHL